MRSCLYGVFACLLVVQVLACAPAGTEVATNGPHSIVDGKRSADSETSASGRSVFAKGHGVGPLALGLGEPLVLNTNAPRRWDLDEQIDALVRLAPATHRVWVSLAEILSSPTAVREETLGRYEHTISRLQQVGISIVAMDHSFPQWMTGQPQYDRLPCRDLTPGSTYQTFLDRYEASWETMVSHFPSVQAWETGNETNHDPFMQPGPCDADGRFTLEEKAAITTDLMFRARRAIRRAQPSALVYMPGVAPIRDDGTIALDGISTFINLLYRNIYSGKWPSTHPRDFFDGASWHPYIWDDPTYANWVSPNLEIYRQIEARGDGGIPVLFSEIGNADMLDTVAHDRMAERLRSSYQLGSAHFPWLSSMVWFRMLDDPHATWGSVSEQSYGVLYSPYHGYAPKSSATVFLSITQAGNDPCSLPVGFFKKGPVIYYSNGNDAFCRYNSWESYKMAGGPDDTRAVREVAHEPRCMHDAGDCVVSL